MSYMSRELQEIFRKEAIRWRVNISLICVVVGKQVEAMEIGRTSRRVVGRHLKTCPKAPYLFVLSRSVHCITGGSWVRVCLVPLSRE